MCGMLEALQFDNGFVRSLAADPEVGPRRRQISNACYSRVEPTPVAAPELVAYAVEVAELLDLTPEDCTSDAFVEVFSGNRLLPGMDPVHRGFHRGRRPGSQAR